MVNLHVVSKRNIHVSKGGALKTWYAQQQALTLGIHHIKVCTLTLRERKTNNNNWSKPQCLANQTTIF